MFKVKIKYMGKELFFKKIFILNMNKKTAGINRRQT